jgi:Chromate transport protein ChrA
MSIYLKIFYIFFKIGLFSFGGGYAMLPLIRQEVVVNNQWLGAKEFTDLVAISQATPGPIAINGATYVGYKVGGIIGSIAGNIGVILPSVIIMLILTKFFFKFKDNKYMEDAFSGLRPATVGLIAAAAILLIPDSFTDYKSLLIFGGAFIASYKYKVDPILLTIIAGVLGLIIYR